LDAQILMFVDVVFSEPWAPEEDDRLRDCVAINGTSNWSVVAEHKPEREGKQCRERWYNHLSPDVNKGAWTEEEDRIIISMQEKIGNQWAKITKLLPGRSDNAVKNRFHMAMRAKNREMRSQVTDAIIEQELKHHVKPPRSSYEKHSFGSSIAEGKESSMHTHTTSTSPVVLPTNCELTGLVPVIQSFPSPPMSPSVAIDIENGEEFMMMNENEDGFHMYSSMEDDEDALEYEEDLESPNIYEAEAMSPPTIPFVEAEVYTEEQIHQFYLQQQQQQYMHHHYQHQHQQQQEVVESTIPLGSQGVMENWLNNDDSMMEGIEELLGATPIAVSPASVVEEPSAQLVDEDSSNGMYMPPIEPVTSPMQGYQQDPNMNGMYYGQPAASAMPGSAAYEQEISMSFMNDDDDHILMNWVQEEMEEYNLQMQSGSTYGGGNGHRSSSKRCGNTNWCGIGFTESSFSSSSQRWGATNSAFCGLGTSWKPASPNLPAVSQYNSNGPAGIGMGNNRDASPVRKQQRQSSGWRNMFSHK
jgi:hypothetical protein